MCGAQRDKTLRKPLDSVTKENCWITIFLIQEALLRKSDNLKPLFSHNEELCISEKGKRKCSCIRGQIMPTKQLPQKINMSVTTSQYVISGKITFAQLKLSPPGHNLPARHEQTTFSTSQSWHFHTALRELHQRSLSALRTETSFWFHYDGPEIQIWLCSINNHTDESYLSLKERAIFFLCQFSFSKWAQQSLYITRVLSCFYMSRENLGQAS